MTRHYLLAGLILPFIMLSQFSFAQTKIKPQGDDVFEGDLRTNMSASAEWKISDKFSLEGEYMMLTNHNVSRLFRNQFGIGCAYSPCKYVDIGLGYDYIAQYAKTGALKPKHRAYFTVEGSLNVGNWKLSLLERFHYTYSAHDIDPYSKVRNSLDLRSRIKGAYTSLKLLEPYALVEIWNCFNDPAYSAEYNQLTKTYRNTVFLGYTDAYINKVRGSIGLKLKLNEHHSLDLAYALDYCHNVDIEYNSILDNLESYQWDNKLASNLSLSYAFTF